MIKVDIERLVGGPHGGFKIKVNAKFPLNSITHILGPSGTGKTTFLKILAGLILPDAGTINYNGEQWFDAEIGFSKKVQQRKIGFVFQDYALFPNMTVREHLVFGNDDAEYLNRLLEIGEMAALAERYPRQLSGGQRQRLALLRALSTRPKLLLLDEPFSALDSELKIKIINKLIPLFNEESMTVILVSHQENEFIGVPVTRYDLPISEV